MLREDFGAVRAKPHTEHNTATPRAVEATRRDIICNVQLPTQDR